MTIHKKQYPVKPGMMPFFDKNCNVYIYLFLQLKYSLADIPLSLGGDSLIPFVSEFVPQMADVESSLLCKSCCC